MLLQISLPLGSLQLHCQLCSRNGCPHGQQQFNWSVSVQHYIRISNSCQNFIPRFRLHEVDQNIWFCYECRECYVPGTLVCSKYLMEFDWTVLAGIWNIKFIVAIIKRVGHIRIILQRSNPHCKTFTRTEKYVTNTTRPCHKPPTGQVWQVDMMIIGLLFPFYFLGCKRYRPTISVHLSVNL